MVESFRALLTPTSKLQYLAWRVARRTSPITLRLPEGRSFVMRPLPASDYGVAYEVFVFRCYEHSWLPPTARRIVDLGGNVGYSVLNWAWRYPEAQIEVFEPHPANLAILRANMAGNHLDSRVRVHPVAAGTAPGTVTLSDHGAHSAVGQLGITVPVVDLFATLGTSPIDVLKMDIEGSEHALLSDPRFVALPIRTLVLEWHRTPHVQEAERSVRDRLTGLGFTVEPGRKDSPDPKIGVLWGSRERTPQGTVGPEDPGRAAVVAVEF